VDNINNFYEKNSGKMIGYAMNIKKGGKGHSMSRVDAEDLIHNLYIKHTENPESFDEKWIWNHINNKRTDAFKQVIRDAQLKAKYRGMIVEEERVECDPMDRMIEEELVAMVHDEIRHIKDPVKKEVLTRHYINGEGTMSVLASVEGANDKMISRFRDKMADKFKEYSLYEEDSV